MARTVLLKLGFQDSWRELFPIHSGISDKRAAVLTQLGLYIFSPKVYNLFYWNLQNTYSYKIICFYILHILVNILFLYLSIFQLLCTNNILINTTIFLNFIIYLPKFAFGSISIMFFF